MAEGAIFPESPTDGYLDKEAVMDVSVWWLLGAFLIGGYSGALLVALMSVAANDGGSAGRIGGRRHMSERNANPRWSV